MESPIKERTVTDIQATIEKHQSIPRMLAAYALTGCDMMSACFGVGKGTMLKVLKSVSPLNVIGTVDAAWSGVMEQATHVDSQNLTQCQRSGLVCGECKLEDLDQQLLPSFTPCHQLQRHLLRMTCIWKNALELDPPILETTNYGWIKEESTKSLLPTTVPANVYLAPNDILKLTQCTCTCGMPCKFSRCGCNNAKLACTIFCSCHASLNAVMSKLEQQWLWLMKTKTCEGYDSTL